jgi:pimeloyl-ACP methyl ester carboxylesterase
LFQSTDYKRLLRIFALQSRKICLNATKVSSQSNEVLPVKIKKYSFVTAMVLLLCACQTNSVKTDDPDMPQNAYLDGKTSRVGVVLCHGRGKYPTWSVVDPLRKGIHEQLGYHTLSIQMPRDDVGWRDYAAFFPEAHKRIVAAIRYLKEIKKVDKVYLMGHSMGSRMATSFLADNPQSGVAGFIGVGIRNGGDDPLDSNANLRIVNIPVLDVYGDGGNGKDARHADERSDMAGKNYQQVLIPGASHTLTLHEQEMVNAVVSWLKERNG